jgi:CBS-domain-containing membrane protein
LLGDDFSRAHPLSLTCYRGDIHEALFRGSMHPAFDLVKRLCEVLYGEALTETSTRFVTLPVALTSGVLLVASFVCGCIGSQLVC